MMERPLLTSGGDGLSLKKGEGSDEGERKRGREEKGRGERVRHTKGVNNKPACVMFA